MAKGCTRKCQRDQQQTNSFHKLSHVSNQPFSLAQAFEPKPGPILQLASHCYIADSMGVLTKSRNRFSRHTASIFNNLSVPLPKAAGAQGATASARTSRYEKSHVNTRCVGQKTTLGRASIRKTRYAGGGRRCCGLLPRPKAQLILSSGRVTK